MSDRFKKIFDTGNFSLDEIKKKLFQLAYDMAVEIVDDATQLMPKDIRGKLKQSVKDSFEKKISGADISVKGFEGKYNAQPIPPEDDFDESVFEKEFTVTKTYPNADEGIVPEERPDTIYYPHEALIGEQDEQDMYMADKIVQMRKLEEVSHKGYIVKRCVEVTIVRQGEFMKDVEDCYLPTAFCGIQRPVYAAMSRSQLRTYFTWRTYWRKGLHNDTDKSYILLYCYEVLNKIGFESSDAAFRELVLIWLELKDKALFLNDLMPRWIKDFYAFNRVSEPLPQFYEEFKEAAVCSELLGGDYGDKLEYLADHSNYNIRCSVFISSANKPILNGACEAALKALETHFKKFGAELSGLICGRSKKDFSWTPFEGALVNLDQQDGFETTEISALERYCLKRGEPAHEVFEFAPSKDFIGYLLKCVEARVRIRMGFNRKLSPNISMIKNELANRSKLQKAVADPAFEGLIANAVDEYFRVNNISAAPSGRGGLDDNAASFAAPGVEIDVTRLGDIREQSQRNVERLIVPEGVYSEADIGKALNRVADDEFSAAVADASEPGAASDGGQKDALKKPLGILTEDKFIITAPENADDLEFPQSPPEELLSDWYELSMNLIPLHIEILEHIAAGDLNEFCRVHDILPNSSIEQINEEALNFVGDVIIEGGEFVEFYEKDILKMLKLLKQAREQ